MNGESDWDHVAEAGMVEGPIEKVTRKEMAMAVEAMEPGERQLDSLECVQG